MGGGGGGVEGAEGFATYKHCQDGSSLNVVWQAMCATLSLVESGRLVSFPPVWDLTVTFLDKTDNYVKNAE